MSDICLAPGFSETGPLKSSRVSLLYRGDASEGRGSYSHHAHITFFNGLLIAMWSNHPADEDAPGQFVRCSFSSDMGLRWSEPRYLFPPMEKPLRSPDVRPNGVPIDGHRLHDRCGSGVSSPNSWENDLCGHYHITMCANGFAQVNGRLYAVAEPSTLVNNRGIGRVARQIADGLPYGSAFFLNAHDRPDIAALTPDALNRELYSPANDSPDRAAINECLRSPFNLPQWDFYAGSDTAELILPEGKSQYQLEAQSDVDINEPTHAVRRADGTIAWFWRSQYNCLLSQFSSDGGVTWSELFHTPLPDGRSRAWAGNLPDGSVCIVNNPGPGRDRLCISLSPDGHAFTRRADVASCAPPRREEGRAKDLGYQYPSAVAAGGFLFVAYSCNKEDVYVSRIELEELKRL